MTSGADSLPEERSEWQRTTLQFVQSLIDRRLATILSMTHCPSDRKIDPKDVTTVGGRQEVWQIWPWGEAMIFRT